MANINDDEREGYVESDGTVARNCVSLGSGTGTSGNSNDLQRNANTVFEGEEAKNIIHL